MGCKVGGRGCQLGRLGGLADLCQQGGEVGCEVGGGGCQLRFLRRLADRREQGGAKLRQVGGGAKAVGDGVKPLGQGGGHVQNRVRAVGQGVDLRGEAVDLHRLGGDGGPGMDGLRRDGLTQIGQLAVQTGGKVVQFAVQQVQRGDGGAGLVGLCGDRAAQIGQLAVEPHHQIIELAIQPQKRRLGLGEAADLMGNLLDGGQHRCQVIRHGVGDLRHGEQDRLEPRAEDVQTTRLGCGVQAFAQGEFQR